MTLAELIETRPYPLNVVCELVPFPSMNALYLFLFKHKHQFPGVYRRSKGFAQRMMTGDEILRMRELTINAEAGNRFGRSPGRPRGTTSRIQPRRSSGSHGLLSNIIAKATT